MGQQTIQILKDKFVDIKTPTGSDFNDWIDSFWHKSVKIPATQIEIINGAGGGLTPALDSDFFSIKKSHSLSESQAIQVGNIWTNILSSTTGKSQNYLIVTTWDDGSVMDDTKLDGVIYRKRGTEYLKLITDESVDVNLFGAKADGITDDTVAIQSAVDITSRLGLKLTFGSGTFLIKAHHETDWTKGGVQLRNNTYISINPKVTLKVIPNDKTNYAIFQIRNCDNVHVYGGVFIGDRNEHLGTKGEWGYGIYSHDSKNIIIDGGSFSDFWGDGMAFGGSAYSTGNNIGCNNVLINNVTCQKNRRQGISIVSGSYFTIRKSTFKDTEGTAPQCGIDLEPNNYQTVSNVLIDDCEFINNRSVGLGIYALTEQAKVHDIVVNNSFFASNYDGGIHTAAKRNTLNEEVRNISVNDCFFDITNNVPINISNGSHDINLKGLHIKLDNPDKNRQFIVCTHVDRIKMNDIRLYGSGSNAIEVKDACNNITIESVTSDIDCSNLIYLAGGYGYTLNNIRSKTERSGNKINLQSVRDTIIDNIKLLLKSNNPAIYLFSTTSNEACRNVKIKNADITHNWLTAEKKVSSIKVTTSESIIIDNCIINGNVDYSIDSVANKSIISENTSNLPLFIAGNYCKILSNTISEASQGISVESLKYSIIRSNIINSTQIFGITLRKSDFNNIENNIIDNVCKSNPQYSCGIRLIESSNNIVTSNTINSLSSNRLTTAFYYYDDKSRNNYYVNNNATGEYVIAEFNEIDGSDNVSMKSKQILDNVPNSATTEDITSILTEIRAIKTELINSGLMKK